MKPSINDTILIDTSVWVDFLRGVETPQCEYLKQILPIAIIAICPTILQEILQGVLDNKKRLIVNSYFKHLLRLPGDAYFMAEQAQDFKGYLFLTNFRIFIIYVLSRL